MVFKAKNIIRGESLSIDKRLNSPERCNHLKCVHSYNEKKWQLLKYFSSLTTNQEKNSFEGERNKEGFVG